MQTFLVLLGVLYLGVMGNNASVPTSDMTSSRRCVSDTVNMSCPGNRQIQVEAVVYGRAAGGCLRGSAAGGPGGGRQVCEGHDLSFHPCTGLRACLSRVPHKNLPGCGRADFVTLTHRCLKAKEIHDICGSSGQVLTQPAGYVASPNYPTHLPANTQRCHVTVTLPDPGVRVYVVDLGKGDCQGVLELTEPGGAGGRKVRLCAKTIAGRGQQVYETRTNSLHITYSQGAGATTAKGFLLYYNSTRQATEDTFESGRPETTISILQSPPEVITQPVFQLGLPPVVTQRTTPPTTQRSPLYPRMPPTRTPHKPTPSRARPAPHASNGVSLWGMPPVHREIPVAPEGVPPAKLYDVSTMTPEILLTTSPPEGDTTTQTGWRHNTSVLSRDESRLSGQWAAIVGGVIASIAGLLLLVIVAIMIWEKRKKKCARTQLYDDVMFGERPPPPGVTPPALPPPRQRPYENVQTVNGGFVQDLPHPTQGFQWPVVTGSVSGNGREEGGGIGGVEGKRNSGGKGKKRKDGKGNAGKQGQSDCDGIGVGQGIGQGGEQAERGGSRATTPTRRVYQNAELEGEVDGRTSRGSQTSKTSTGLGQKREPYDDVSLSLSRQPKAKPSSLPQSPAPSNALTQPYCRSLSDVHPHPNPPIMPPPRPLSAADHAHPRPGHAHQRPVPAQRRSLSLRISDPPLPLDDVYCEVGEQFSPEHLETGASMVPAPPVRNSSKKTTAGGQTKGSRPPGIKPPLKPKPKKESLKQWLGRATGRRGSRGKDPPQSPDDLIDVTMVENDVYESEDVRRS